MTQADDPYSPKRCLLFFFSKLLEPGTKFSPNSGEWIPNLASRVPPLSSSPFLTVSDTKDSPLLSLARIRVLSHDWKDLETICCMSERRWIDFTQSKPHIHQGLVFKRSLIRFVRGDSKKKEFSEKGLKKALKLMVFGLFSPLKNPFKVSEKDAYNSLFFFFLNPDLSSKEIKLKFEFGFLLSSCWFAAEPR